MKKYVALSVGILLFAFTNCAQPLPDMLDEQPSSGGLATDPASAGLTGTFGTPGDVVNPPLMTSPAPGTTVTVSPPPPSEDNSTTTLYRFFNVINGQHFSTGNSTEASYPWQLDGTSFKVFKMPYNHRHPIYRCYVEESGDHFTTGDSKCEGPLYKFEGLYGYVENGATTVAPRALHRCFHLAYGHMDSTNPKECTDAGYRDEGIIGYVP